MSRNITAAALIIGNELLTGKVQDQNVAVLARVLFELGISLERVIICPDEIDVIVSDLNGLRRDHDYVFTSGGVGPTHDDVTVAAVARAFERPLIRLPEIEELLRRHFGESLREEHSRMAEVPEGATLLWGDANRWPTVRMENVLILPGVPQLFQRKLDALREHLVGGAPLISRGIDCSGDEWEIAPLLEQVVRDYPDVSIGSYPRWGEGPVRVRVTLDGRDREDVDRAFEALCQALTPDRIVP